MKLENAVVLITGANRGLGLAFAKEALARGARKVYAAARNPASIMLEGVIPVKLDVNNPDDVARVARDYDDVTLLINNAGVHRQTNLLDDDSIEVVRSVLETNLLGMLSVSKSFAPTLIKNGGGVIANVLSAGCWLSGHGHLAYSMSKAAALSLTNDMRIALNPHGVQVTAIHAGFIDTDMMSGFPGKK